MALKSFLKTLVPAGILAGSTLLSGCREKEKLPPHVAYDAEELPPSLISVDSDRTLDEARAEAIYKHIRQMNGAFISYCPFRDDDGNIRVGFGVAITPETFLTLPLYHQTERGVFPYDKKENSALLEQLETKGQTREIRLRDEEIRTLSKAWIQNAYREMRKTFPTLDTLPLSTVAALCFLEMNSDSVQTPAAELNQLANGGVDLGGMLKVFTPTQTLKNGEQLFLTHSTRSPAALETELLSRLRRNKVPAIPGRDILLKQAGTQTIRR